MSLIQVIFYGLIVLGLLSVLLAGKRKLQVGTAWIVFLLAFGLRRVFLNNYLEFHPAEIMIWFLGALMLLEHKRSLPQEARFHLPPWLVLFMLFWPLGWLLSYLSGTALDQALNQFKPFLILPLVFWLAWKLLRDANGWYILVTSLFITGTITAILGLIEYVSPGMASRIPGFTNSPGAMISVNSFLRARYSFYGAPTATFMLVVTAPLGLALLCWTKTPGQKLLISGAAILQATGIYIGGYRSIWLALGVQVVIFLFLNYGPLLGGIALVPVGFIYESLPQEALVRMASLFSAVEGQPLDSSAVKRIARIEEALAALWKHPFGTGWASSGWTHNDFLQIGLSVGVLGLFVFIVAYLATAFGLAKHLWPMRRDRNTTDFQFGLGILLSFIGSGFLYATQGITWQIFLVLPAWLSWAMATYWFTMFPMAVSSEIKNEAEALGPAAHFQQRAANPPHAGIRPLGR